MSLSQNALNAVNIKKRGCVMIASAEKCSSPTEGVIRVSDLMIEIKSLEDEMLEAENAIDFDRPKTMNRIIRARAAYHSPVDIINKFAREGKIYG
jgi:hypothetical protein